MSELQDMLRVQARLHRKQGANALGDLFQSAALEIEILTERLENPQGLQELICVEQMKEISLPEIHRANQKLHEQLAKANERVRDLEKDLTVSNGFIAKKMPIVFAISGKNKGAKLVYEEAVKVLNKFAIEKKIEAYKLVLNEYGRSMHPDHKSSLGFLIEQLRKEQEHG